MTPTARSVLPDASVSGREDIDRAVAAHDESVAALGLDIWVGNEPTFTDRFSQATEWLTGAVGEDKRQRTEGLLAVLARGRPGDAILRSIGRQYPGEAQPRGSIGLYGWRDDRPLWTGPLDPLLLGAGAPRADPADWQVAFATHLGDALSQRGFIHQRFTGPAELRLVCACDGRTALPVPGDDPRLLRPSIHAGAIPSQGLGDPLSRDGLLLLIVGQEVVSGRLAPCLELPAAATVERFAALLSAAGEAATKAGLSSLVLRGFPPPVDATVRWATVTPDPAVVEVNGAPHATVSDFLRDNRTCYAAATQVGLAPYRLYYNGVVADSGGGGQITFGGPSPARSPFFVAPRLLPRLVRYVARHPAISYLFAHDHVGSFGQSVRPDELGTDVLAELRLALRLLASEPSPSPTLIWQALAPFLTDATGNSHRAELNVEKLWNASQPDRGMLGLVELRAFRMQHTPERAAAIAALIRAVLAHLIVAGDALERLELPEWRSELHDRFALPFYLEEDLRQVLADLRRSGVGLEPALVRELQADHWRQWASFELGGCLIGIRRALDFWFLIGDASNQLGTSRLVDASTSRIELTLRPAPTGATDASLGWRVRANDVELPLRNEADPRGPVRVVGIRYRSFVPRWGLHPTLGTQSPLRLVFIPPGEAGPAHELTLHDWLPDGGSYQGVPADLSEAKTRREARCVWRLLAPGAVAPARPTPPGAGGGMTVDLRYASAMPVAAGAGTPARGERARSPAPPVNPSTDR